MKKQYIIKKNWEFQNVINSKKQFITKKIIFYYVPNEKFEIGISVPKKFANAVKRNYLKRQIKAIIDKNIDYYNLRYKIVLIARKDFIELPFLEKEHEINKIFNKLITK